MLLNPKMFRQLNASVEYILFWVLWILLDDDEFAQAFMRITSSASIYTGDVCYDSRTFAVSVKLYSSTYKTVSCCSWPFRQVKSRNYKHFDWKEVCVWLARWIRASGILSVVAPVAKATITPLHRWQLVSCRLKLKPSLPHHVGLPPTACAYVCLCMPPRERVRVRE